MTNQSVLKEGLTVERTELAEALRIVRSEMGRRISGATVWFEDGSLYVAAGNAVATAAAQGIWPFTIIVSTSWVRRLAKSLPPGDPVFLHIKNGRLYANNYSEPCERSETKTPIRPSLGKVGENRRILEAATVLEGFLVTREDLRSLVENARKRGPISWREDEGTMISAVSKAWALLAVFGVETADLRRLVDVAVRDAWKARSTNDKETH